MDNNKAKKAVTVANATNVKRRLRFKPELETSALLDPVVKGDSFNPTIPCLVLNESFNGCALIALASSPLKVGDLVKAKIGLLAIMKAEVKWRKVIDEDSVRIGLFFLE